MTPLLLPPDLRDALEQSWRKALQREADADMQRLRYRCAFLMSDRALRVRPVKP